MAANRGALPLIVFFLFVLIIEVKSYSHQTKWGEKGRKTTLFAFSSISNQLHKNN